MNTTVFTKDGEQDNYPSLANAESKNEIYDSIAKAYTDEDIDYIQVQYDDIEVSALDGRKVEPGAIVTVHTLEELRAELGKYGG